MWELLIITFISSWTPLKGVLAKLSYCSHEKQFRLPVHLGEEKEMVHPKAKATIPPLSFHQDKCLPLQCYQTHTHSHGGGGGVVPCHWWYIVALERDILLCCRKQMDNPFPATVWRLKFKSNATFKQMSEYKIKTVLSMPGFKQRKSTVWHLGVIFSLRVFMPSYKINLVIVQGEKKFKKSACEPTLHKQVFFFCSHFTSNTLLETFLHAPPTQYKSAPERSQTWLRHCQAWHCHLSRAASGPHCWLTAWMCLIINGAARATTEGLWWQKLRPECLPLPFRQPKCHLNEIGPRS